MLWRHGRTSWNDDRRFQGQTDIELDDHGRRQARRTARLLAALPPDALLSSDLSRARATAAELAALTGLPVAVDPRLRETHAGRWEGLLAQEIQEADAATWQAWLARGPGRTARGRRDAGRGRRPGGEPPSPRRCRRCASGGVLVVATHGGTARALIGRLLGLPEAEWHVLGGLANCSWSVLAESDARLAPGGAQRGTAARAGRGHRRRVTRVLLSRPNRFRAVPPRRLCCPGPPGPHGAIAQLVEHLLGRQGVRGSNPLSSTPISAGQRHNGRGD